MLGTYINFDAGFATSTMSYMGTLVSDFSTPISLIIGVGLAVGAIAILMNIIFKHK